MRRQALRWVAVAVGLGLLVGGISAAVADDRVESSAPTSPATTTSAASSDFGPAGPGPSDSPDPALSDEPVPTVPPGDPGTDDDAAERQDEHRDGDEPDKGRLAAVPKGALLDAGTVGAIAGGSWAAGTAPVDGCLTGTAVGAAAGTSSQLTAADGSGNLVQAVATWQSVRTAMSGLDTIAGSLVDCGFTGTGDPRLGDASATFERTVDGSAQKVTVIAVEGATVVLTGTGSAAADGVWESLADVSMGTLCVAGVHGCH